LELRWFRNLRPCLHPWIEITPRAGGNAEFYDFVTANRLNLNPTAYMIVERMHSREHTLGEIAAELADHFDKDERELLVAVVDVYKYLESHDETVHPCWRYVILYMQHLRQYFQDARNVFVQMFFRGLAGG